MSTSIGVEVYERPASFDPHIDTIVRTEARRLRSKLHDYYDDEGRDDLILVDVPKGTYAPRFLKRTAGISDSQVGQLISRYRVLRKIREGGMGEIYLAEDTVLGRPVALKFHLWKPAQGQREAHSVVQGSARGRFD